MKVLGIETSVATGTLAVVSDKAVLGEIVVSDDLKHSTNITARVDQLLKKTNTPLAEMDLIAVGLGPGSFTGIRIGVAFAKGVQTALGIPVAGFTGFEAIFRKIKDAKGSGPAAYRRIAVLIDAGREEFYCRVYENGGKGFAVSGKDFITKFAGLEKIAAKGSTFAGPGLSGILKRRNVPMRVQLREPKVLRVADFDKIETEILDIAPSARCVALLGAELPIADRKNYSDLEPVYLRKTQAEEKSFPLP